MAENKQEIEATTTSVEQPQVTAESPTSGDFSGYIPIEELKFEEAEIAELGSQLPVGLYFEGEHLNDCILKPYKTEYDRKLGQYLKMNQRAGLIKVLGLFLPHVVESIGGYTLAQLSQKMAISESRIFEGMFLGDVLSIVMRLRMQAQGEDIAISATCPNCGTKNNDGPERGYHQLTTTTVKYINKLSQKLVVGVRLQDGIQIGPDLVKLILMKPLVLHQAGKIGKDDRATPEDVSMMYEMICGLPESEYYRSARGSNIFSDEHYDVLTAKDLKILRDAIKKLQPGPEMVIDMECYACGHEWQEGIAWGRVREFLYYSDTAA
jgi:hypothetical protein